MSYIQNFIQDLTTFMSQIDQSHSLFTPIPNSSLNLNIHVSQIESLEYSALTSITESPVSPTESTEILPLVVGLLPRKQYILPKESSNSWSQKHDDFLLKIVYSYSSNWKKIQNRIHKTFRIKRDLTFLKEKYYRIKSTHKEKKGRFDEIEDKQIIKMVEKNGKNWSLISKSFEGRNPIMIKNRFYYLNKSLKATY